VYSKNKQIVCIDWHEPGKGTLGCAYVQKLDFQQRVDKLGLVDPAVVLVWDFADNINPQYILEGPSDMFCFRCPSPSPTPSARPLALTLSRSPLGSTPQTPTGW
jgi:hypothetical protein